MEGREEEEEVGGGQGGPADMFIPRWRVLALKVRFGLGAAQLAVKKRNMNDITSFIDHETEVGEVG